MDEQRLSLPAEIARAYARHLSGRPVESSLLATVAYFATLVIVRSFTTFVRAEPVQPDISIAGVHIHHLVFGIVALLVSGLFALDEVFRIARSVLFGIGAALVLDEFALLVFLRDVYWLPQGSLSVVAIVIGFGALIVNAWRGRSFLQAVALLVSRRM